MPVVVVVDTTILTVGQAWFQRADELRAEIDFADTDGMEPEDVAVRQRLLEVRRRSGRIAGKSPETSRRAATFARSNTAMTARKKS